MITFKKTRKKIKKRYISLKNKIYFLVSKNALVFGMPFHSNAGDQAQSYCIELWIKQNYPDYKIRWFDALSMNHSGYHELTKLKKIVKKSDLIFLHSGYHTTDLYMLEEKLQRNVIQSFPEKQIVILPQTINYQTQEERNNSIQIYNNHDNIVLFCRDNTSYELAKQIFYNCKLYLFPDIVTSLIGKRKYNYNRKGVLLCFRNDKEAYIKKEEKKEISQKISKIDYVETTDTTLDVNADYFIQHRGQVLEDLWDYYSHFRVVITDRYHGTIFSLIANTPVIVLPSTDHKLQSGVEWFPDSYKEYISFCSDMDFIEKYVLQVYKNEYSYELPSYFQERYYNKMKEIIEDNQ